MRFTPNDVAPAMTRLKTFGRGNAVEHDLEIERIDTADRRRSDAAVQNADANRVTRLNAEDIAHVRSLIIGERKVRSEQHEIHFCLLLSAFCFLI
jgi:hypothetical protein